MPCLHLRHHSGRLFHCQIVSTPLKVVVTLDAARYLPRMMMIYSTIASRYRA